MRIRTAQLQEIIAQTRREKRAELVRGLGADDPTALIDPAAGTAVLTDARGHASTVELSDQGLAGIRTAMGRQYRLDRDAEGRLTRLEAQGHLRYDIAYTQGALSEIRRDGTPLIQLAYRPPEGMVEARFPDGTVEKLRFDPSGERLLRTTDALGNETHLVRDSAGHVIELRDARGHSTFFSHDEDGDPTATRFPDGTREEYEATDEGMDVLLNGNLHASLVTTDDGELESVRFADGHEIRFRFSEDLPLEGDNASHQVKFAYDGEGRMIAEELDGQRVEFLYDADGNIAELRGPAGPLRYRHDGDDLLTSVSTWDGSEITFTYARSGQISRIEFPNGVTTVVDATPGGQIRGITTSGAAAGARAIVRDTYEYDARDRVSARRRLEAESTFRYDPAGRLTEVLQAIAPPEIRGAPTQQPRERYAYDAAGNRTGANGRAAVFDAMNKLVEDGVETFRHDAAGNLIGRSGGARNRAGTYRYNGQGLLTETVGAQDWPVRFTYDAFGRRVTKQAGTAQTRYVWAGRQLLREETTREGASVERRDYLYYPGEHLPLAVRINGKSYYYHTDRAGTVLAMTDAGGQVVWQADYSAFGEVTVRVETVPQPLRSLGHYHDTETGLYYNLFRYYDPRLGRYLTPDPLRYESGRTNFYPYADNDPVNRSDPEGHFIIPAALLIIAGAALIGGLIGGAISAAQGGSFWKGAAAGAVAGAIGAAAPILGAAAGLTGVALAGVALAGDAIAGGVQTCMEGDASLGTFAQGAGIALATTLLTAGLARIPGVRKVVQKLANKVGGRLKQLYYRLRPKQLLLKRAARKVASRIKKLRAQGHGPQRHEGQVTEQQLKDRARLKHDPETGTRSDKYAKKDGTPANHKCADDATKINSEEAYVKGESHLRSQPDFKNQVATGKSKITVKAPLEDVYGPGYKNEVSGQSRTGPPFPDVSSPTKPTDFTDGKLVAHYKKKPDGGYELVTMYPAPK